MILASDLSKTYRVHKRSPGVAAAVRSLWHRTYDEVRAVEALSLEIAAGERVGFLGPNGAGKTTTLKMLSGLLHPTSGTAEVAGFTPGRRSPEFLRSITLVMGQKQQLLWDLPPAETFAMNRAIYGVSKADFDATLCELTELLELGDLVQKPARNLSLGERMKCELVAALLHKPKVLFLDEPTIGLDVAMQAAVRDFIRRYNERHGATVLLTSHYMADVLALCPRVIVIDKGRLLFDGALGDLVRRTRPGKRAELKFSMEVAKDDVARFGRVVEHEALRTVLDMDTSDLSQALSGLLATLPVADVTIEEPPLEEVLRDLFSRSREAARA